MAWLASLLTGAPLWEDPVMNIGKIVGLASYTVSVGGNTPLVSYEFAVSAEDCTPAVSTLVAATAVAP